MRILFISNLYPPYELGGLELRCREVVDGFQMRGHVCHVLTSRYGVDGQPPSESNATRSLFLEADVHHYRPLDFFVRRPWQEYANRRALRSALETFRPDVTFIWGMWNLSPRLACWAEQWMPGRVAYSIGSYWPLDIDTHRAYWTNVGKTTAARILLWPVSRFALGLLKVERYPPRPRFRHVSCCSQYLVDVLTAGGVLPSSAVAILNGIDPEPFITNQRQARKPNGPLRLVYFGGLMEHKGVHTAIEALGLLKQHNWADRLQLTIIGGGQPEYETCLHALTESLALQDKVLFVGRVPRSEIPLILLDHDIFLFTSIWAEPFGRTILEAMAARLAVIGSDVGGSKEIFQHYPGGTVFAPGDAEALAHQIQRFLEEPDLTQSLGQAGQSLVLERFTLERMLDDIEAWLAAVAP